MMQYHGEESQNIGYEGMHWSYDNHNVGIISAFCRPWPPPMPTIVPETERFVYHEQDEHWSDHLANLNDTDFVRILSAFCSSTSLVSDTTDLYCPSSHTDVSPTAIAISTLSESQVRKPRVTHSKKRLFKGCKSLQEILRHAFSTDSMSPMTTRSSKRSRSTAQSAELSTRFEYAVGSPQARSPDRLEGPLGYEDNRAQVLRQIERRTADLEIQEQQFKAKLYRAQIEQQILLDSRDTVELRIQELQRRKVAQAQRDGKRKR